MTSSKKKFICVASVCKNERQEHNERKKYYLPCDPNKTPIPAEMYREVMRPSFKYRYYLRNSGRCSPPRGYVCINDCSSCKFYNSELDLSLDYSKECTIPCDYDMEENVGQKLLREEMVRCLSQLSVIDRIIVECTILNDEPVSERKIAEKISKIIGTPYTHQAVHKRIPIAAKQLADLMGYKY